MKPLIQGIIEYNYRNYVDLLHRISNSTYTQYNCKISHLGNLGYYTVGLKQKRYEKEPFFVFLQIKCFEFCFIFIRIKI